MMVVFICRQQAEHRLPYGEVNVGTALVADPATPPADR